MWQAMHDFFMFGSGSRKLVLSDDCIPKVPFPSDQQHGKEGRKEGSRRSPQGDESDEGKEGVDVSAVESVLLCCLLGNTDCFNS